MGITRRQAAEAIELHQILADQPYLSEAEAREVLRCDLGSVGLESSCRCRTRLQPPIATRHFKDFVLLMQMAHLSSSQQNRAVHSV